MRQTSIKRNLCVVLATLIQSNTFLVQHSEATIWSERKKAAQSQVALVSNIPAPHTNNNWAETAQFSPSLHTKQEQINKFGSIRSKKNTNKIRPHQPHIIHVQDLHLHHEAQNNISNALHALIKNGNYDLIAIEGAFGRIPLSDFHKFPHQDSVQQAADLLLKNKVIAGALHAAITMGPAFRPIIGIDDKKLYKNNVGAYLAAFKDIQAKRDAIYKEIDKTNKEKISIFNPELLEFDTLVQAYQNKNLSLIDYVARLNELSNNKYRSLTSFAQAGQLEKLINFDQAKAEQNIILSNLTPKLSPIKRRELEIHARKFKGNIINHAEFYGFLENLIHESAFNLNSFPHFRNALSYVQLSETLDMEIFWKDLANLEKEIAANRCITLQEKALMNKSRFLTLAHKLVEFSMTSEEWAEYQASKKINSSLGHFERFYKTAELRDHKMAENLSRVINETNAEKIILVTGGFHRSGIQRHLSKTFTIETFVPRITSIETTGPSSYLSVFARQKTPLEVLFSGTKVWLSPEQGTPVQLFSARLLVDAAEIFKGRRTPQLTKGWNAIRHQLDKFVRFIPTHSSVHVEIEVGRNNNELLMPVVVSSAGLFWISAVAVFYLQAPLSLYTVALIPFFLLFDGPRHKLVSIIETNAGIQNLKNKIDQIITHQTGSSTPESNPLDKFIPAEKKAQLNDDIYLRKIKSEYYEKKKSFNETNGRSVEIKIAELMIWLNESIWSQKYPPVLETIRGRMNVYTELVNELAKELIRVRLSTVPDSIKNHIFIALGAESGRQELVSSSMLEFSIITDGTKTEEFEKGLSDLIDDLRESIQVAFKKKAKIQTIATISNIKETIDLILLNENKPDPDERPSARKRSEAQKNAFKKLEKLFQPFDFEYVGGSTEIWQLLNAQLATISAQYKHSLVRFVAENFNEQLAGESVVTAVHEQINLDLEYSMGAIRTYNLITWLEKHILKSNSLLSPSERKKINQAAHFLFLLRSYLGHYMYFDINEERDKPITSVNQSFLIEALALAICDQEFNDGKTYRKAWTDLIGKTRVDVRVEDISGVALLKQYYSSAEIIANGAIRALILAQNIATHRQTSIENIFNRALETEAVRKGSSIIKGTPSDFSDFKISDPQTAHLASLKNYFQIKRNNWNHLFNPSYGFQFDARDKLVIRIKPNAENLFLHNPIMIFYIFEAAARLRLPLDDKIRLLIEEACPNLKEFFLKPVKDDLIKYARASFLNIYEQDTDISWIDWEFYRLGLWDLLIPELDLIKNISNIGRDHGRHIYARDTHVLKARELFERFYRKTPFTGYQIAQHPDMVKTLTHNFESLRTPKTLKLLRLIILLHDIGNPSWRNWANVPHDHIGADIIAPEVLSRLNVPLDDQTHIRWAIRNDAMFSPGLRYPILDKNAAGEDIFNPESLAYTALIINDGQPKIDDTLFKLRFRLMYMLSYVDRGAVDPSDQTFFSDFNEELSFLYNYISAGKIDTDLVRKTIKTIKTRYKNIIQSIRSSKGDNSQNLVTDKLVDLYFKTVPPSYWINRSPYIIYDIISAMNDPQKPVSVMFEVPFVQGPHDSEHDKFEKDRRNTATDSPVILTIITQLDRKGLLADVSGILLAAGFNILSSEISTAYVNDNPNGKRPVLLDHFYISSPTEFARRDENGNPVTFTKLELNIKELRKDLEEHISRVILAEPSQRKKLFEDFLIRQKSDYSVELKPTVVASITKSKDGNEDVINFRGEDYQGFFHVACRILHEVFDLNIINARVITSDKVFDQFSVNPIHNEQTKLEIKAAFLELTRLSHLRRQQGLFKINVNELIAYLQQKKSDGTLRILSQHFSPNHSSKPYGMMPVYRELYVKAQELAHLNPRLWFLPYLSITLLAFIEEVLFRQFGVLVLTTFSWGVFHSNPLVIPGLYAFIFATLLHPSLLFPAEPGRIKLGMSEHVLGVTRARGQLFLFAFLMGLLQPYIGYTGLWIIHTALNASLHYFQTHHKLHLPPIPYFMMGIGNRSTNHIAHLLDNKTFDLGLRNAGVFVTAVEAGLQPTWKHHNEIMSIIKRGIPESLNTTTQTNLALSGVQLRAFLNSSKQDLADLPPQTNSAENKSRFIILTRNHFKKNSAALTRLLNTAAIDKPGQHVFIVSDTASLTQHARRIKDDNPKQFSNVRIIETNNNAFIGNAFLWENFEDHLSHELPDEKNHINTSSIDIICPPQVTINVDLSRQHAFIDREIMKNADLIWISSNLKIVRLMESLGTLINIGRALLSAA